MLWGGPSSNIKFRYAVKQNFTAPAMSRIENITEICKLKDADKEKIESASVM